MPKPDAVLPSQRLNVVSVTSRCHTSLLLWHSVMCRLHRMSIMSVHVHYDSIQPVWRNMFALPLHQLPVILRPLHRPAPAVSSLMIGRSDNPVRGRLDCPGLLCDWFVNGDENGFDRQPEWVEGLCKWSAGNWTGCVACSFVGMWRDERETGWFWTSRLNDDVYCWAWYEEQS